jgi:hypothetical protein
MEGKFRADSFGHFQILLKAENSRDEINVRFYNMQPHEKVLVDVKEGESKSVVVTTDEYESEDWN